MTSYSVNILRGQIKQKQERETKDISIIRDVELLCIAGFIHLVCVIREAKLR